MKNYFLLAVALSALCSSCETEDETLKNETINSTKAVHAGKYSDHIAIYRNCISTFAYNPLNLFEENMHAYEAHVNNFIQGEQGYEPFNLDKYIQLQVVPYDVLHQLPYSNLFKTEVISILNNQGFNADENLLSASEYSLLNTLSILHDDTDDKDWKKNNRTIAFAYGAQYSFKQAVLYAGAVELSRYQQ